MASKKKLSTEEHGLSERQTRRTIIRTSQKKIKKGHLITRNRVSFQRDKRRVRDKIVFSQQIISLIQPTDQGVIETDTKSN